MTTSTERAYEVAVQRAAHLIPLRTQRVRQILTDAIDAAIASGDLIPRDRLIHFDDSVVHGPLYRLLDEEPKP